MLWITIILKFRKLCLKMVFHRSSQIASLLTPFHIQKICSRQLRKHSRQNYWKLSINENINIEYMTVVFSVYCRSNCVYMWERFNHYVYKSTHLSINSNYCWNFPGSFFSCFRWQVNWTLYKTGRADFWWNLNDLEKTF